MIKENRTLKGLLLEMKISDNVDERILAEEMIVNLFSDQEAEIAHLKIESGVSMTILTNIIKEKEARIQRLREALDQTKENIGNEGKKYTIQRIREALATDLEGGKDE